MVGPPSKSLFPILLADQPLVPCTSGHLRWFILVILVLNPTHEFAWSISEFFPLRGRVLRAGPPGPLCFLFFVFSHPPTTSNAQGRPLTERSKNLGPIGDPILCSSRDVSPWTWYLSRLSAQRRARTPLLRSAKSVTPNKLLQPPKDRYTRTADGRRGLGQHPRRHLSSFELLELSLASRGLRCCCFR